MGIIKLSDCWETPNEFFHVFDRVFHFTLDVCATKANSKCKKFFSPEDNGLKQSWAGEVCWCNPGRSNVKPWMEKAYPEMEEGGATSFVLVHAGVSSGWFHEFAPLAYRVLLLKPRIQYIPPLGVKASSNARDDVAFIFRPDSEKGENIRLCKWK